MTRDPRALPGLASGWCPARPIGPVLIQVPDLSSTTRPARRHSGQAAVRRRRRLRREVRVAGTILLLATPLAWGALTARTDEPESLGVSARLIGIEGMGAPFASGDERPRITAAREPAATAPSPRRRGPHAPVILPGYVLPDDDPEESPHAGS